jgi:hypothetical protein
LAFCTNADKAQNKASECSESSTTHSFRHASRGSQLFFDSLEKPSASRPGPEIPI